MPRAEPGAFTVKDLGNEFRNHKEALLDVVELSPRTWAEYKKTCDQLVANFGKHRLVADPVADDFAKLRNKLAKRFRPVRLGTTIQRVRSVVKLPS